MFKKNRQRCLVMKLLVFKLHRWNFLVAQFATVKYSDQIQTTSSIQWLYNRVPSLHVGHIRWKIPPE